MLAYVQENDIPVFTPVSPLAVWDAAPVGAADTVSLNFSGLTFARQERDISAPFLSYKGAQWQDAYYPQLIFSPQSVDVGLVSARIYVTLKFWNASDEALTINSISAGGADGVSITGISLPLTLRPTEEGSFIFAVSEIGLPVIEAVFTFNTSRGATTAKITGTRGVIIPFKPDWSQAFKISRFRKTVRLASLSTSEERRSMESRALSKLSFQVLTMSAVETEQLKRIGLQSGSSLIGVPLWPEGLRISAAIPASGVIIPTDTTALYNFKEGDLVIIWESPQHWALKTVSLVQSSAICIVQTAGTAFPAGSWIVPVLTGKLTSRPEFTHLNDELSQAQIDFEEQV